MIRWFVTKCAIGGQGKKKKNLYCPSTRCWHREHNNAILQMTVENSFMVLVLAFQKFWLEGKFGHVYSHMRAFKPYTYLYTYITFNWLNNNIYAFVTFFLTTNWWGGGPLHTGFIFIFLFDSTEGREWNKVKAWNVRWWLRFWRSLQLKESHLACTRWT